MRLLSRYLLRQLAGPFVFALAALTSLMLLSQIAKKFGFKDFNEYDDVASNIALVMAGIDPQTKAFTDPPTAIKREIEEITADKSMPEKERKQALDELAEAMKMAQPIQFPGNIEIVKKYYDRLEPLLQ